MTTDPMTPDRTDGGGGMSERCSVCGGDRTNLKHLRHEDAPKGHKHYGTESACHPFTPQPTPPTERCPVEGCDELPEDHYHPAPEPVTDEALRELVEKMLERWDNGYIAADRAIVDQLRIALAAARPAPVLDGLVEEVLAAARDLMLTLGDFYWRPEEASRASAAMLRFEHRIAALAARTEDVCEGCGSPWKASSHEPPKIACCPDCTHAARRVARTEGR